MKPLEDSMPVRRLSVPIALALAACVMMGLAIGSCGGDAIAPTAG